MIDLFAIALMVLSCLLSPADAKRFLVDVLDPESGRVQTLTGSRTAGGFELVGPDGREGRLSITDKGKGSYAVLLPGEEEPITIDLGETLAGLDRAAQVQTLPLQDGKVRLSRGRDLLYLARVEAERPTLFVVRAAPATAAIAPAAPAFQEPATALGEEGDFKGWQQYARPWELTRAQAKAGLAGGQTSPAEAVVAFFASLMRGDDGFQTVLSPNFKPELREVLVEGIKQSTASLARVVGHAFVAKGTLLKLEKSSLGDMPRKFVEFFGDYEVLMFCEGNTSADDIVVLLEEVEGKWCVKGVSARFLELRKR